MNSNQEFSNVAEYLPVDDRYSLVATSNGMMDARLNTIKAYLLIWDEHFGGERSYEDLRNKFLDRLFMAKEERKQLLRRRYRILSHHSPGDVRLKLGNVAQEFEEFKKNVHSLITEKRANFENLKGEVGRINDNTLGTLLKYDVGGEKFHLTPSQNEQLQMLQAQLDWGDDDEQEYRFVNRDPGPFPRLVSPFLKTDVTPELTRERNFFVAPYPPEVQFLYLVLFHVKRWTMEYFPETYTTHHWAVGSYSICNMEHMEYMFNVFFANGGRGDDRGCYNLGHKVKDVMITERWALEYPDWQNVYRPGKFALRRHFKSEPAPLQSLQDALSSQSITTDIIMKRSPWYQTNDDAAVCVTLIFAPRPDFGDKYITKTPKI